MYLRILPHPNASHYSTIYGEEYASTEAFASDTDLWDS